MKNHILISDAQQLFKESLNSVINEIDSNYVCKQYCSYKDLKQGVKDFNDNIALVVLSTNLADIKNINLTLLNLNTLTKAPILVITSINSQFFAQDVVNSGATTCLLKTESHENCKESIHNLLIGKKYIQAKKSNIFNDKLTKRQYEVLSEISQGLLNKQIANKLNISESTVKIHISSILIKLSVNNRTEAAVKFFRET